MERVSRWIQALTTNAPSSFSRSSGESCSCANNSKNGISLDMPSFFPLYLIRKTAPAAYSFSISSIRCVHKPLLRHLVKDLSFAENQALALAARNAHVGG